ncbi:MAG: pyruvate dehydrogenase complex dihydrolipoamide acetyltransferase [Pseudomonadota bacterium]
MPTPILMPALSPTMTEGKLAKWLKKEGEEVKAGDVIAEIETDKATMEVEAVDEGKLGRIVVPAGTENVAVNAPIAYLLGEGEDASAIEAAAKAAPAAKPAAPAPSPAAPKPAPAAQPAVAPTPAPAPQAAAPRPPAPTTMPSAPAPGARVFASPLARRLAAEAGIELAHVPGSGPHGRIVKADIEAAKVSGAPALRAPVPGIVPPGAPPTPLPTEGFVELPLSTMRKVIARRLAESKQTIPHFYLTIEVELDALLALRQQLNAKSDAYKLSVNDFIIKACGLALAKVPRTNALWGGDKILQNRSCDVSVAVALEDGLITPIVRAADKKGLAAISAEMKAMIEKAKAGKLMPEDYQGGAFSLSNLGMYGIKEFAAVINPPQGSILAVGKGEQRPVVKGGALSIATMMSCTLSCDHRVVDGALGAQFLDAFKKLVEDPLTMML